MKEVTYQVGKNGITDNMVSDAVANLRKGKYVRIKFLRSFLGEKDRFSASEEVLSKLKEKVVLQSRLVGNVLQLKRKENI